MPRTRSRILHGIRFARHGLLINALLVVVKVVAGVLGHSYALIADGIESSLDVFSSLIVWRGLAVSGRSADEEFHFGYGKAEAVAGAAVGLLLIGAAVALALQVLRGIALPQQMPEPFTLAVLVLVILVKEVLFHRVFAAGTEIESAALQADAWHHRADAITSLAAFLGISTALVTGWKVADDYAALVAVLVIAFNGFRMLRPALADLMDRAPEPAIVAEVRAAAEAVPGVLATEKLRARKAGLGYYVDLHVQADPELSLQDAHLLGGRVRSAVLERLPSVIDALIHMEPYEEERIKSRE